MRLKLKILAIIMLAFAFTLTSSGFVPHIVRAQFTPSPLSYVYITPVKNGPYSLGQQVTVNVYLNLTSGESMDSFDVRINYTNYHSNGVVGTLNAMSVDYSNNLFSSYYPNSVDVLGECVNGLIVQGQSTSCSSDTIGQVHLTEALVGQTLLKGPFSRELFSVTFNVTGYGSSQFLVDQANIVNPYADPSNPTQLNPQFIQVLKSGAVFGNKGVVAFFNFRPANPSISPAILPANVNDPASFDASPSFVTYNQSIPITTYSWNFGDHSAVENKTIATDTHVYDAPGNYTVTLTVVDARGDTNQTSRVVPVVTALGTLSLTVEDQSGTPIAGSVLVQLFNTSSSTTPFSTRVPDVAGGVTFNSLTPQNYTVRFSGGGFIDASKTETVIPGWTTSDAIYLNQAPIPQNFSELIYGAAIVAATAAFGVTILYQRRKKAKKLAKPQASSKTKNKNSS